MNLLILAIFKYYDFFVTEFAQLFHISTDGLLLKVILPVGISFYTFQALSYSIDVYRGKIEPTKDIVAFFAFISFFPQLVAGPIERATNLLPQFLKKREFNYDTAVDGMRQILWGLFKKIVVADNCAVYVDKVFSTYTEQTGSIYMIAADKYDAYESLIVNKHKCNHLLDYFPSNDSIINTKELLLPYILAGTQDVYRVDDTHWSPVGSNIVGIEVADRIKKLNP